MEEMIPEKSSRKFTKTIVVFNLVMIWVLMLSSVYYQQAEHVVAPAVALIGTIFGIYAGVGHLDFRKAVELSIDSVTSKEEHNE